MGNQSVTGHQVLPKSHSILDMRALLTVTCYIVIWLMDKKFGGFAAKES